MERTREAITQNLAERLCWQAARRDDARVARRLYRKQVVDGVYQLDEGAVLDDFFHFLRSCSGSPPKSAQSTAARSRRSLPDVGFGARSQKPVGSAGWVAALYIRVHFD